MRAPIGVAVIGGGVVGVAVARSLALAGLGVVLLERHARLGTEISSRNSGVLHAGLYYPEGSTKAQACVEGRRALVSYCGARGVPYRMTGKLVLAADEAEVPALLALAQRARANGARIEERDGAALARDEPLLRAAHALHSPDSGIVDAHALIEALARDAVAAGATILPRAELVYASPDGEGHVLVVARPDGEERVQARLVVVAAGLEGSRVRRLFGLPDGPELALYKGDYFRLASSAPRPRCALVYPMPERAGLGVHLTSDLGGVVRAGPDATFVETPVYDVDPDKRAVFGRALRRYLPAIEDVHLEPDFAGVRPKLAQDGSFRDFLVEGPAAHGRAGLLNLLGIESPGLTACLALADLVAREVAAMP